MLYLYALPSGILARQIETFRNVCERDFGRNRAHDWPIHCTLTRGFAIDGTDPEDYRDAITRHFAGTRKPVVGKLRHTAQKQLVVLELQAPDLALSTRSWIDEIGRDDVTIIESGFHVTIAWETRFHERIFELAQEVIHQSMDVSWEVSLCERLDSEQPPRWLVPSGLLLI